jgi:CheY-like chemotaxis protein
MVAASVIALLENSDHGVLLKSCLKESGVNLSVVDSYVKAKALVRLQPCSLIFCDVHLENGGSVFDFLKWVKDDAQLRSIPFVFLSIEPSFLAKYLADGVRVAARQLGAAKYISMEVFDAAHLQQELVEFLPKQEQSTQILQTNQTKD